MDVIMEEHEEERKTISQFKFTPESQITLKAKKIEAKVLSQPD